MDPITIITVVAGLDGYDLNSLSVLDMDGIYWPITN
jgi:hypothetical protein